MGRISDDRRERRPVSSGTKSSASSGKINARKMYSIIIGLMICTVFVIVAFTALVSIKNQINKKESFAESYRKATEDVSNAGKSKGKIVIDVLRETFSSEPVETTEVKTTEPTTEGALIWPIKDLDIYAELPNKGAPPDGSISSDMVAGKAQTAKTLQVISENGVYFHVNCDGIDGYIDSRYCMINLPDYLGNELEYNITNSYSSIFYAHDYKLYGITETIIPGFEDIKTGNAEYLVPYLYPCAKKLHIVAMRVIDDGYKLKVYEAFRPHKATRFLYDTTQTYLNKPVPEKDENGNELVGFDEEGNVVLSSSKYPPYGSVVGYDGSILLSDLTTPVAPPGSASEYPAGTLIGENGAALDASGAQIGTITLDGSTPTETYAKVITGGKYNLGAFLAAKASAHNKGIALDITLCDINTKEDLKMQTNMHDLSYHSVLSENNDNANLLAMYMKEGGFNDLVSEWWHFQDDDTKNELGINFVVEEGVGPLG